MRKRILLTIILINMAAFLTACRDVQIFITPEPENAVEVSDTEIETDTYYIKNGTKFSKVYLPNGNVSGKSGKVSQSRVFYFQGDEAKVPVHYKGELIAYASAKANLTKVVLERFKDMEYSIGIFGGKVEDDGYYHINITKNNTVIDSSAQKLFNQVPSAEIRIVTIGGTPVAKLVDAGSGIITGLKQDGTYDIEFFAGTYFYRTTVTADTHFLRSYEIYNYGETLISDTTHGYMCFSTPEDLKSGWYLINGIGLFQYHSFTRSEEAAADETLNEKYYQTTEELVASYTKQYQVSVPSTVKDMIISVKYGEVTDATDVDSEITGYVIAPDGTGYEMLVDSEDKKMTLNLAVAGAGDWMVYIYPKSLDIADVSVASDSVMEDTTCEEMTFELLEDTEYQRFYADVSGEGDIYGVIIGPEGITYGMSLETVREKGGKTISYLQYDLAYAKKGTYTMKIYHYLSQTKISNMQMFSYADNSSEIIIIE